MPKQQRNRATVPILSIADDRLRGRDLRVLAAFCFHDPYAKGQPVFARRETLAKLAGITDVNVSHSARRLVSFGWLTKLSNGHRSSPSHYKVNWDHDPRKDVTGDTLSDNERVSRVTPNNDDKGCHGRHPITTKGVTGDTLLPKGCHQCYVLTAKGCHGRHGRHLIYIIGSIYINNHHGSSYSVGSENASAAPEDDGDNYLDVKQARNLLAYHDIELGPRSSQRDMDMVRQWVTDRITPDLLVQAIDRSRQFLKDKPISIGYLHRVISTIREQHHAASQQSGKAGDSFISRGDQLGEEFLRRGSG